MVESLILSRASFKEVLFWVSGGMESTHHLWTSPPMLNHPCCEHFFSLNQNFPYYSLCPFFVPFHCAPPGRIFLLYNPTLHCGRLKLCPHVAFVSPGWIKRDCFLLYVCPSPWSSQQPSTGLPSVCQCLPCTGCRTLLWSHNHWIEGKNQFRHVLAKLSAILPSKQNSL